MRASRVPSLLLSAMLLLAFPSPSLSQNNHQTPPMGWNSWNHFGLRHKPPTDPMIRAQALAMVNSGMQAVGYTYVNIDDEWQGTRDSQGNIQPDPTNFPNGMAVLAAYVHSLGLKIGIYSSPGEKTCSGHIGSYGQ